jgi:hypothetical protein
MFGVADGFHEQQDRVGMRIIDQQAGLFADAEVGFIADLNEF